MAGDEVSADVVIMADTGTVVSPATTVSFRASLFSVKVGVGGCHLLDPHVYIAVGDDGRVHLEVCNGSNTSHDCETRVASYTLDESGNWIADT